MNFEKLTNYLDSLEKTYQIPACDCKIMKQHEVIYRRTIGFSDYKKNIPLTADNIFRLFSATKLVTITAVLQLIEKKQLGLYDELANYLPEFGKLFVADNFVLKPPVRWPQTGDPCHLAHNSIRIIDLITMTAGLSYNTTSSEFTELKKNRNKTATTREVVSKIAKMPLIYEPRTRWAYSLAHDVLAAVVEVISGMKFSEYLKTYIFNPLGIRDMYFHWNNDKELSNRICALYMGISGTDGIQPDNGILSNSFKITENYESGGAGLAGTVDAYSIFADALCNEGIGINGCRILSKEMIQLFMTGYTIGLMQSDFESAGKEGYRYGLGVRVHSSSQKGNSPIGEFGWDGAAGSYVLIDPINNICIFYAQHILDFPKVYSEIHPTIRDLTYEAIIS